MLLSCRRRKECRHALHCDGGIESAPAGRISAISEIACGHRGDRAFVLRQAGTYNVNGRKPPPGLDLRPWLAGAPESDIIVIGFQEIVALNASNVMNGAILSSSARCRYSCLTTWGARLLRSPGVVSACH